VIDSRQRMNNVASKINGGSRVVKINSLLSSILSVNGRNDTTIPAITNPTVYGMWTRCVTIATNVAMNNKR